MDTVVTLADLVSFAPEQAADQMEPKGWMVVGLPANFYASAPVQVVDGRLLGFPASVRFTPVGYHWVYGDGGTADSRSPGASWARLGLPEFSSTATSHVFQAAGSYTIGLSVQYTAEYRFAGRSWRSVTGSLRASANELPAIAGQARTVLVERECTRNPAGPGC